MNRRTFIKEASLAVLATSSVRTFGAEAKRIAFGGIQIECSTYGDILSRMEDFTVVRDQALADSRRYAFLKSYPHTFMPTLVASAVPGGQVERKTYDAFKAEFVESPAQVASARRPLPPHARGDEGGGHARRRG